MNKNAHKKTLNKAGYTLIELLIVIGLIGITIGVTGDIVLSLIRSYAKTQATNELERSTNFVVSKIEKEFKNATSIASVSGNELEFTTKLMDSATPLTVKYEVANCTASGQTVRCLKRSVNGASPVEVTDPETIKLTCVGQCFKDANPSSTPKAVTINMKFEKNNGGSTSTAFSGEVIIKTTVVAKGTY